jgi:hypothetical protein
MAGFLEYLMNPATQGMLNLSAGLLQAGGPSRMPVSFGQALGQGLQQGTQGVQQAQQMQMQQQAFGMKQAEALRQQENEAARAAALARLAADPRFAGMSDLLTVAPNAAIEQAFPKPQASPFSRLQPKDYTPDSLAKFQQTGKVSDLVAVQAPTAPMTRKVRRGDKEVTQSFVDGKWVDEEVGEAFSPRPLVDVKVPVNVGNSLAGQVGDIAKEGRVAASGAVDVVGTVDRISQAIDQGNVNLGPTATLRTKADQFAQVIGIGGKSTEERLVNTRNAIRGLAQFTVNARKSLKGQGSITADEQKLLAKAESGEIDDFTIPELKEFLKVTERIARKTHDEHRRVIGVMANSKDENVRSLVPYFDIPDMPAPRSSTPSGGKVIRYDASGKRIP